MAQFRTGVVTGILAERPGLQRVEVDGRPAYVLTRLTGSVAQGDRVVVNTTAVDLGLGSGGWDVVHWNLERSELSTPSGGPVMKLRYTSLQVDVGAEEENRDPVPGSRPDLGGLPVVACDLHSQVACVARAFAAAAPGRRLVYVMTDSAALPIALSDEVARLRAGGILAMAITAGQAFGGDSEAVNVASAVGMAWARAGAAAVVVGPGPGAVGTASPLGFGGVEVVGILDMTSVLGGRPIVAVRSSDADPRGRHRGVSHHTATVLDLVSHAVTIPVPAGEETSHQWPERHEVRVVDARAEECDGVESMGRDHRSDPGFFRWSAAAGRVAAEMALGR